MSSLLPLKSSTESLQNRDVDPKLVDFEDADADEILTVISSTTARHILAALYDEPQTPSDLAEAVETSVQNVSYHLDRLREAGLIETVDTWYSRQGREMEVYAPAHGPLVLFSGATRADPSLASALQRLFGALGIVALASVLVHDVWRSRQPTVLATPPLDAAARLRTQFEMFLAGPGALTLAAGLGLVGGLFLLWYWRIYRPAQHQSGENLTL